MGTRIEKRLEDVTPSDVVRFFETSQDVGLRQLASDVKKSFPRDGDYVIVTDVTSVIGRLSDIINDDGGFKRGANAVIAELVFGDRSKTGGSYNRKIQQVKTEIRGVVAMLQGSSIEVLAEYEVSNATNRAVD